MTNQEAAEMIRDDMKLHHDYLSGTYRKALNMAISALNAPPEIVRCKDCEHRDPEDKKCDSGHSIQWQLPRSDDWFCADAERRTDD